MCFAIRNDSDVDDIYNDHNQYKCIGIVMHVENLKVYYTDIEIIRFCFFPSIRVYDISYITVTKQLQNVISS